MAMTCGRPCSSAASCMAQTGTRTSLRICSSAGGVRQRNRTKFAAAERHRQLTAQQVARQRCRSAPAAASSAPSGTSAADSKLSERDDLKKQLIRSTANTQRGRKASEQQQAAILDAAKALEALNPTDSPATSPLINGRWSLLYQGPEEVTKKREPLEGPVIDFFRPLLGFLFRTQGVFQVIDTGRGAVDNLVKFKFASLMNGSLSVAGTVAPAQLKAARGPVARVDVKFTSFRLQLGWLPLSLPLGWADPKGWVETTYVDESFRIGHGDKGSIFITSKTKGQEQK